MQQPFTKLGFMRSYVIPALFMFVIPVVGYWFGNYAKTDFDTKFIAELSRIVQLNDTLTAESKQYVVEFYSNNPISSLCATGETSKLTPIANDPDSFCSDHDQIRWIIQASLGSILIGLLSVFVVLGCVAWSFISRRAQYLSFLVGWNFLRVVSTLQVIVQGFILVMLSYWLTAFFFQKYYVKLIMGIGIVALLAAYNVIMAIFKKPDRVFAVEGTVLLKEQAPTLWAHVGTVCSHLNTSPPDNIIAGIDDNFFVTEHPVQIENDNLDLKGRTLFVSLPLLKCLDKTEADAILAHEMAHFSGGDTLYSKKLSPLLAKYTTYMSGLEDGLALPIFYFMLFYWSIFQISLGTSSRQRELRADKIAADITTPFNVAGALLRCTAYSSYRAKVENWLFGQNTLHLELNIAQNISIGFVEYANGPGLLTDIYDNVFPHPFDTHPPLLVRLEAIGVQIAREKIAEQVIATPVQTWYTQISNAETVETALWSRYEKRFCAIHEETLAHRYLPSTDEELAHVQRFFPVCQFYDKKGAVALVINCMQLYCAKLDTAIAWSNITAITVIETTFRGKCLNINHRSDGAKAVSAIIPIGKLKEKSDVVIETVNTYWSRYQHAKAYADSIGG